VSTHVGTVKWFSDAKGFGFLSDGESDYFVHHTVIQMEGHRTLTPGQKVTFDVGPGEKGPRAVNVVPVATA